MKNKGALEWAKEMLGLVDEMRAWTTASISRQKDTPWRGGHDEASFVSSWFGYYHLTGEGRVLDFLKFLLEGFLKWSNHHLYHGYWPEGEVHHSPETFIFFLPRFLEFSPPPEGLVEAIEDAAHHIGNWIKNLPEWYDWKGHRFLSFRIGTKVVDLAPEHTYEVPDHFRLIQLALVAYYATKKSQYLELCTDYADRWSRLILESKGPIPARIPPENHENMAQNLERHISAGTVDVFLDLFSFTKNGRYIEAASKILNETVPAISDPLSQTPGALFAKYRTAARDTSFDRAIMERIEKMPEGPKEAELIALPAKPDLPHPMGIGRRRDQPRWAYRLPDGGIEEEQGPSPASLYLAWQITHQMDYLRRAFAKSAARIRYARKHFEDGRSHGCAAKTTGAIASGHGRAAMIGAVNSTLYQAALGSYRFSGLEPPCVAYFTGEKPGLPPQVAPLVTKSTDTERSLLIANLATRPISLRIEPRRTKLNVIGANVDGQRIEPLNTKAVQIDLKPKHPTSLTIELGSSLKHLSLIVRRGTTNGERSP